MQTDSSAPRVRCPIVALHCDATLLRNLRGLADARVRSEASKKGTAISAFEQNSEIPGAATRFPPPLSSCNESPCRW